MAKYIDADEFKKVLKEFAESVFGININGFLSACFATQAMKKIDDFPAADVEEVKHGEWIEENYGYAACSVCRADTNSLDSEGFPIGRESESQRWASYCPHCGAKMDGGKQ